MQQSRFEFVMEAERPIQHSEGTYGNASVLMTRQVRYENASVQIPMVTGDTMRHKMREAIAYALLDAAGRIDDPQLSAPALRLLFNGGMLTGRGDASLIKLDELRAMMKVIPSLALFGGCVNSNMINGQLAVSDLLLLCQETTRYVPPWIREWTAENNVQLDTYREYIEVEQRVRMDAVLDRRKRHLLSPTERDTQERLLVAREKAHNEDNAIAREETKSHMMPRTAEVIAMGSMFSWSVTATTYSDLELDTLNTTIAAFLLNARVGGAERTDHGRIRAIVGNKIALARPREAIESVDIQALAPRVGQLFRAHVAEHKEELKQVLSEIDA